MVSKKVLKAAENMDWQQVVLNGGPPCFHLEERYGMFCGRAERWCGHHMDGNGHKALHEFVSLKQLLSESDCEHGNGTR